MQLTDVLSALEKSGKPGTAKIYARHGVKGPSFGVPYSVLGALTKKIGTDHALALGLWKSGNHDARVLATKVVDTDALDEKTAVAWLSACDNYVITDAVSGVIARAPFGLALARRLIDSEGEWTASAGWNVISILAKEGALPEELAGALLTRIEKTLHDAPNRARHAMNNALIGIGGYLPGQRAAALKAAKAIGAVKVDHGETGCVTPAAAPYIAKMADRAKAKRSRVTGSSMIATKKARKKPAAKKPAAKKR